jgi:hypothetical protein
MRKKLKKIYIDGAESLQVGPCDVGMCRTETHEFNPFVVCICYGWDVIKTKFCCVREPDDGDRDVACVPRAIGECSSGWEYSDIVDVGQTIKTDIKMSVVVFILYGYDFEPDILSVFRTVILDT